MAFLNLLEVPPQTMQFGMIRVWHHNFFLSVVKTEGQVNTRVPIKKNILYPLNLSLPPKPPIYLSSPSMTPGAGGAVLNLVEVEEGSL